MQVLQEFLTQETLMYTEVLQDPRASLVLVVHLERMVMMVGLEEWACVVLQVSLDLMEKTEFLALQDAQRKAMLEMMDTLALLACLDHKAVEGHQAFQVTKVFQGTLPMGLRVQMVSLASLVKMVSQDQGVHLDLKVPRDSLVKE
ncbi:uncharacterized protein LOC123513291 [Portunus trituberculatus]|uniref:uncharacterized protein LOC123513291 n=1 Tax=Portunus trituberculatus TaxID=210409 RepID=UPI001E1D1124|nr:uncharacterized protein LOC123513291 [Portunus trituberculatus]